MDLVFAGQTRRRQGLLSLFSFSLWGLALFLLSLLFLEEEWRTSGKEEEYDLCFFLFFLFYSD